jgi:multidrug efflux pump subunit AcrA (membrane-fusion protein)
MSSGESLPDSISRQLIELTQSAPPIHSFSRQLLRIILDAVNAMAVTLWLVRENELILSDEIEETVGAVRSLRLTDEAQQNALRRAFEKSQVSLLQDGAAGFDPLNPAVEPRSVVFIPVPGLRGNLGVVRVIFEPMPRQVVTRLIQLAEAICGYYSLYSAQRLLTIQQEERQDIDRLSKAILQLQHYTFSPQLPEVLVNSAIEVTPLDRVVLLVAPLKGGGKELRVGAVSSVAQAQRKGAWSRVACELGEVVLEKGKPLQFFPGRTRPEEIEDEELRRQVNSYVLMSEVKSLVVYPLTAGEDKAGVLICERFADPPLSPFERVLLTVYASHVASALCNYRLFTSMPLSSFYARKLDRKAGEARGAPFRTLRIAKWTAIGIAVLIVFWFVALHRVPEKVKAECFVEPAVTRTVTAKLEGEIRDVLFRKGQKVEEGDLLIRFRTDDFELALRKGVEDGANIEAEINKLRSQAETEIDAARKGAILAEIQVRQHSLAAKKEEIKILQNRLKDCYIYSPIEGVILEPEDPERLVGVTVQAGEPLCRVGAISQQVRVKVAVPGERVSEVKPGLETEVLLRPFLQERLLTGSIAAVAERSVNYKNTNVFMADVLLPNVRSPSAENLAEASQFDLKPGMTGKAKIVLPAKSTYLSIYGRLVYRKLKYWLF